MNVKKHVFTTIYVKKSTNILSNMKIGSRMGKTRFLRAVSKSSASRRQVKERPADNPRNSW